MLRRIILLVSILVAVLLVAIVAAVVLIDPDDYRDEIAARASETLGREVRLEGPIDLKWFPWLSFEVSDMVVANPPDFADQPEVAEIGRARASLRILPLLRGHMEIGTVELSKAVLTVVRRADGSSNLDGLFGPSDRHSEPRDATDLSGLRTGEVRFDNVVLRLIDRDAGQIQTLRIDELALAPFRPGQPVPLQLRAVILDAGESALLTIAFDGRLELAADLSRLSVAEASVRFALPDADVSGEFTTAVEADFGDGARVRLSALDLSATAGELQLALTGRSPVELRLGETTDLEAPELRLALNGQPLAVQGEARLDERLRARIEVSGERLNLTALPTGDEQEPRDEAAADFDALQWFDLHMALELGELVLAENLVLNSVNGQGRLDGGVLVIEPMTAEVLGGRFDGRARVDFNRQPPLVEVTPRLSGVLVERLAGLFSDHAPVDGQAEMDLNLRFQGFSPAEMLASLDGEGRFNIHQGAVRGVDLRRLIEEELTTSNLANIQRAFGGETPFRDLGGTLRAEEGVIELPDLNLSADGYGASGNGRIDFATGRLEYRLDLALGEELTARMPSRLRRATRGRIPLLITGPMDSPVVTVDIAGMAERALFDEIGRRLLEGGAENDDGSDEEGDAPPPQDGR